MRHSLARLGAIATVILTGTLLALLPMSSANAGTCTYGYFCAFDLDNWEGAKKSWSGNENHYGDSGFNNEASSVANNGRPATYDIVLAYDWAYYQDNAGVMCIRRGEWIDMGWAWDEEISSHKWSSRCP